MSALVSGWYIQNRSSHLPLFTILGLVVRSGTDAEDPDTTVSLPLVYALLPSKTEVHYTLVLQKVKEAAARFRIRAAAAPTKNAIHSLLALAFVPVDQLLDAFDQLERMVPQAAGQVFRYFEVTYIRGPRGRGRRRAARTPHYAVEMWNTYDATLADEHRTNNISEGWHNRFQVREMGERCYRGGREEYYIYKKFSTARHRKETPVSLLLEKYYWELKIWEKTYWKKRIGKNGREPSEKYVLYAT